MVKKHSKPKIMDSLLTRLLPLLVLVSIAILCYANSLKCGYVSDDSWTVIENPINETGHPIQTAFTTKVPVRNYCDSPAIYRPLSVLSLWVNWKVSESAWSFHLVNLLLHAATVLLLYLLVLKIWRQRDLAFATSALFAVWPAHVESVTWISSRNDLLSGLFVVGALLALYAWRYEWYVILMALSLLSKESAAVLPILGLISTIRSSKRIIWPHILALGALALVLIGRHYAVWSNHAAQVISSTPSTPHMPFWEAVAGTVVYMAGYLKISTLPVLASYPHIPEITLSALVGAVLTLTAWLAVWLIFRKRLPQVRIGLAWFVVMAGLTTPIVYSQFVLCDRYVYLAQMGIALAISSILLTIGRAGKAIIATLVIIACIFTISNNRIWQNDISYWSYISRSNPSEAGAINNLGAAYLREGKIDEAIPFLEKASQTEPSNVAGHANLGVVYLQVGRQEDAVRELEMAHQLAPDNQDIEQLLEQVRQSAGQGTPSTLHATP